MTVVTGVNGEFRYEGQRVAKCRSFSIDISRDALETTGVGDHDRTYEAGIRGATGSATIIYETDDLATTQLLNSVFSPLAKKKVSMYFNTLTNKSLDCDIIVTQVGAPVSVGEVTACNISFQVSGPIEGSF